jgi:predicted RNA-binding Zn ribbon-like protein
VEVQCQFLWIQSKIYYVDPEKLLRGRFTKTHRIKLYETINQHFTGRFHQMKIQDSLLAVVTAMALSCFSALPSLAAPAYLVGREPGSRINVRSAPSTSAPSPHYGLVGDRVEVIRSVTGEDGYTWYYVEFPSGARGWIRGDLVSVQSP